MSRIVTFSLAMLSLMCASFAVGQGPHNQCPKQEDLQPCVCQRFCDNCSLVIKCSDVNYMVKIEEAFNRTEDFTALTFYNCGIWHVPIDSLEKKSIQFLSIVNSDMTSVFDWYPPAFSVLQSLTLYNLTLQDTLRWELLSKMHSLRTLTVSRMNFTKIEDHFGISVPKQVRVLHFSRTQTEELGKNVFAPLILLDSIVVRNNEIRTIERTMFPKPFRGTLLDFSYNKIQQLPEDFFTDMPQLKSLLLNSNNIVTIAEEVFAKAPRTVSSVPLRDNPIKCDCKLKWLTKQSRKPFYDAQCFRPEQLKGRPLRELTRRNFLYCL